MSEKEEDKMEEESGDTTPAVTDDPPLEETDAARKHPVPPQVINGLKLKQRDRDRPFKTYNYTPAIVYNTDIVTSGDWYLLSAYDIVGDHIRIHELREGEDLLACVEEYQRDHAKAVIVINIKDNATLPTEMTQSLHKLDNFIVAVLPFSEGGSLLDCLQVQFEDDELFARLDVVSSETTPLEILGEDSDTAVLERMDPSSSHHQLLSVTKGFTLGKFFGSRSNIFDLKAEIKKIMFDNDRMLPVSTDGGLFTMLMANFSQFEKMGKPDTAHVSELIKRFNRYLEASFHFEFPFFLTLVYRLRKFRNLYDCDELGLFITRCIEIFEILPHHQVAQTLLLFLEKKDFDVMFGHEEANTSVFTLLATACKDLMNVSIQIKNSRPNVIASKRVMYCRLLWISVNLKCLSEKGTVTRSDIAIWDKSLVKVSKKIVMTKEVIDDLKLGLEFSTLLALPQEHQFTIHHLGCLLADDKFIRPLSHVRDVIIGLEEFIKTERELLVHVMINLRAHYTGFLQSTDPVAIGRASVEKTILGTLDEGISFLDSITELWHQRKWNNEEQHKDFRAECLKWMMLLLGAVRLTDPNAAQLLKKFLAPKRGSIIADKEYRGSIVQLIVEETRKSFPELSIQRFFPLYKAYRIWPIPFLHDFLKQYRIPINVNLADATWSEFFSEILRRHSSDELQNYVLDFIIRVAASYRKDQRASDFIPDALQLKVPNLFASGSETIESQIEIKFSDFLKGYILRNNLRPMIMKKIQEILGLVSDDKETRFHWIILNVLRMEVIPELKSLQDEEKESTKQFKSLLKLSVTTVTKNVLWFGDLSPHHRFCWGVISAGCNKIPISGDSFEWMFSLQPVVSQLGLVYNVYCKTRKLSGHACLLIEQLPQEVADCNWDDVCNYFQWVRKIQEILHIWQNKFFKYNINYDEILVYASNTVAINSLGQAVCASECVIDIQDISEVKKTFTMCFEQLNCYLIRYVANYAEVKYCNLPELLLNYGVNFPIEIKDSFQSKVIFPGTKQTIPKELKLSNAITASTNGEFEPGQDVALVITKSFSLYDLQKLLEDIGRFLEPIIDHMEMLVFFHLHKSEVFIKHLHKHLNDITTATTSPKPERTFSSTMPSIRPSFRRDRQSIDESLTMKTFQKALNRVKDLLLKILKGTATYSDIIANGALKLEVLNTGQEFGILRKFSDLLEMNRNNCEGLDGMRSMLELFQFTYHIDQIKRVCEQYGLEKCLEDDSLKKLIMIVEEFETEKSRANLTPLQATDKMAYIKEALCLEERTNYNCLELFPAVAGSAAFYQFIKDKQFVGQKGQTLFHEQYQLITAQLQHEEYDENVLNHLRAAFEFIAPFMESHITFHELMSKVTKLDTTNGLKQLETVNENIILITLWFSRAEGDTLENVANELQHILSTGIYQFQLATDSNILLTYQTMQTVRTHRRTGSNAIALEESGEGPNGTKQGLVTLPTVYPSPLPSSMDKKEEPFSNTIGSIEQRWNDEQIADFVRKLGFLDAKKEGGDEIRKFLHLDSIANKLMELFMKLYELGHPLYQRDRRLQPLFCSTAVVEADDMVANLQRTLVEWRNQVDSLRQNYTWLLFFSVPKALNLFSLLDELELDYDSIVQEVSFLFENKEIVREKLKEVIREAIGETQIKIDTTTPMKFLGEFLQFVCGSKELEPYLLKEKRGDNARSLSMSKQPSHLSITSPTASGGPFGVFQLHYAPGYNQCQILRLITHLYDGAPECFEVLQCRSTTTAEELSLFMERIKHHPLCYLILLVNKLPYKLQELLMSLLKNISLPDHPQNGGGNTSTVHFIETSPSVLREVPFITYREYKGGDSGLSFEEAGRLCKKRVLTPSDFSVIQLVYGYAGDGKTHYIRQQLSKSRATLSISVNEAFTPLNAIKSLKKLTSIATECAVFFNFTINPHLDDMQEKDEKNKMAKLMDTIGWFFYHFLVLGYIEDPATGTSYRFPGEQEWDVYIEVPSLDRSRKPEESLRLFNVEIPILGLLGSRHRVHSNTPYTIDRDVQLVCKYLRAYQTGGFKGIDRLYRDGNYPGYPIAVTMANKIIKFSDEPDLTAEECHLLLQKYMPDHIQETKITQKLFIRYMKRRCDFLENNPAFNYNTGAGEILIDEHGKKVKTDTRQLGSTIMRTMLEEVSDFCDPDRKKNWSSKSHQQLIYDGGGSFGLVSLQPESMPEDRRKEYRKIGFKIHSTSQLQERQVLDTLLSRALDLPFQAENRPLSAIDDCNYVLTLDYTIKMLNIHERYSCGVPVIIKGETGVGKTALVDMLSQLWNNALLHIWTNERGRIIDAIRDLMSINVEESLENYQILLEIVSNITSGKDVSISDLITLGQLNDRDKNKGKFYNRLRKILMDMEKDPSIALLKTPVGDKGQYGPINGYFEMAKRDHSAQGTAVLLQAVLRAKIKTTFHKMNVHAAVTPNDIKGFFRPVFEQANILREAYEKADDAKRAKINKIPFVTVFLDEVNTSSCLGLFKEIIVDKTLDGKAIPENVFLVAACNPHRGNSMATHAAETWLRSSYYVRPLHPTLEYLMWDYGSLDQYQERDYVRAKMQMLHKELPNIEIVTLTDLIVESQSLMRRYALRQLTNQKMAPEEAEVSSQSCVSQRDIQRVFTFYQWLMDVYGKLKQHGDDQYLYSRRAVMVSLGIVYYMRLNSVYRAKYEEVLNNKVKMPGEVNFSQAFNDELDFFCNNIELPSGIAKTRALKENLFASIVCTVTHTPLVIVGAPGSSKTLSFNLTIANLKGPESKMDLFRDVGIFKSLDPHYYQCSRRTTSNEIQTVFSRAINRQRSHTKFSLPIYCVVLMDEAGLPEESHESLKVLHYHLDKQEVSFVAITNHVLDAAKTNRAVSLFRPEVTEKDLETLAKGCLCPDPDHPPANLRQDLNTIVRFCPAYTRLMEDTKLKRFFGLRDFIHFINYLRRRRTSGINHQLVMEALERNFNGIYWPNKLETFEAICRSFLHCMPNEREAKVKWRSILEVLKESLEDHPEGGRDENEVRYKLVIDPTEDNSLMHLLIAFGVLKREKTRIYVCSDFPGDSHVQKINTIAAIRHSAIEGHTVVMSQTDDIHESFYDLFNQRFRRIDDPEHGPRYYANIAIGAHLRPCRVHPDFVCVVVVKQTEINTTPAPFLNRFEKYCISHETLLNTALNHLKPCVRIMLQTALKKVNQFIEVVGSDNNTIYGLKAQTTDSLLLSILPPYGHTYKATPPGEPISNKPSTCLLHELLRALRNSAGFAIPPCSVDELVMDAAHLFPLLEKDASFEAALESLTVESANEAVNEALQVLHTAPDPNEEGVASQHEMSQEACLVVSVLQQWLIRYLCKTLMQLMTPEAICLHRKKIPASLIDNYLTHHQHFSLKKLLEHHLLPLQSCDSNAFQCPNKLLCFTRSSSIIHYLPSNYPNPGAFKSSPEEVTHLKELVYDDPTQIQICQVASVQSQTAIQETLRDFTQSDRKMLLLMANMQEGTTEMVNHLRVMIEEAEFQTTPTSKKLFVLLLHFPPAMFFDSCYPSLFLRGWNHYYLDSLGHCPTLHPGQLDIEEWLQRCCFPNQEFQEDTLMVACKHLLNEVLPALTSHVTFGTRSKGPFTRDMKASERSAKLKELLVTKRMGPKLCQMFRTCWTPPIMTDYIERAAKFTQTRESSLNITDAVQTMFHSAFTDFMVVMVTKINAQRNLDILFTANKSIIIEELFLALTNTVSLPKLAQLKILAGNMAQPKPQEYQPNFPYFSTVNKSMEQLIEDSRRIKGNQDNLFEEHIEDDSAAAMMSHSVGPEVEMRDLADLMLSTIEDRLKEKRVSHTDPIFITLSYINDHADSIWDSYFTDLIYHTLHLDMTTSPLSKEVIYAYFADLLSLRPLERFVFLHIYFEYNKVGLASICSLLRPLEKIWAVAAESPHSLAPSGSPSPANDFINVVRQANVPFGDPLMLSKFVISALFSALVGSVFPKGLENVSTLNLQTDILNLWYRTYQRVMSMTALRSHLYSTPIPLYEEAQFNVLHATYSLIHVHPQLNEDVLVKANNMFTILLQRYFKTDLQLKDPNVIPCLSECSSLADELVVIDTRDMFAEDYLRLFHEELFEHFLGHTRGAVSVKDRQWFLRLANSQYMWKASTQLVNETIISSSYSEDLLGAVEKSLNRMKPRIPLNQKVNCIAMAVYKRHLSQLLGHYRQNDAETPANRNPLMMYNPEVRQTIAEVLSDTDINEEPCAYLPTFYQDSSATRASKNSENLIMQQPLCHLYFATLMEHLMDDPREVNSLVRLAGTIAQLARPQSVPVGDKIVLQIEKQAVLQCMLRQVAAIFSDNTNQVIVAKELQPVITELNDLLNDDNTGGGAIGGHRLTLGMHLLHKLKSHRLFIDLFTERYPLIKEVQCLSVFHEQLRTQTKSKPFLFPFMQLQDQGSPLSKLYTQVKTAMLNVHQTKGSLQSLDQLVKVADECFSSKTKSQDRIDRRQAFKMMVWLVTYHEFFANKIPSQPLSLAVKQTLKKYIKSDEIIRLIQCFLNPRWFIEGKELATPLREDAPILRILPNGTTVRIDYDGEKVDPLYDLFIPGRLTPRDESDEDLCYCLANLVGVVIGCQPQSCHLWYHLFSPDELKDTYMTGFMYNSKISPEGLLYDCGVELTPDGQYGRPDYHTHATRGTYSLHSLYFLLWANFGTFCVSMLTQTNSQSKIHGSVISDWQAIRHYCVSQVKTLWLNLRDNLGLSDEERSFLITRCLMNLYKSNYEAPSTMLGKLKTREELDKYETSWHQNVFMPAWQELDEKFEQYSVLWMNKLFQNIRNLETCYPLYPAEKDFLNYMHGLYIEDDNWRLVSRFAVEKQRLEVGGELLPCLIQLYQWLHTHLSHLVTTDRAYNKLKIGQVIKLASRRVDPSLFELYKKVKGLYNKYVELVGGAIGQGACAAVRRGNRIYTIEDDLPLIHFLSDSEEEGEGNDWLYAVIKDIAENQNLFIHSLYATVGNVDIGGHPLARLLTPEFSNIFLAEVNEYSCIVGAQQNICGLSGFLQLVRARLNPSVAYRLANTPINAQSKMMSLSPDKALPRPSLSFNLTHLQEDIVTCYLSGKPIIQDVDGLRTTFKFKEAKTSNIKARESDPMGAVSDITVLCDQLPPNCKIQLEQQQIQYLEYEFHSANYHSLTDIVIGLKTAIGLLIKVVSRDGSLSIRNVEETDLYHLLLSQYGVDDSGDHDSQLQALNQIGIKNVTDSQVRRLSLIKLPLLFSTLVLFVGWVKDGLYDFSSLPLALKVHLQETDCTTLKQLPTKYPENDTNLLAELKSLVDVLLHTEPHFVKEVNNIAHKPITGVLSGLQLITDAEQLPQLVPDSVLVQHYVQFRMVLRKLTSIVEQKVAMETSIDDSINQKQWNEVVDDLWSNALPHLRDQGFAFVDPTLLINSSADRYGFYGDDWEEDTDSEFGGDLNKDASEGVISEDGSLQLMSMDYDDPLLYQEQSYYPSLASTVTKTTTSPATATIELSVRETIQQGLQDQTIRSEILKIINKKKDIDQQAKDWSPQMVAQFLEGMGKKQHAKVFLEEDVSGIQLLMAERDVFEELGVKSHVECALIGVSFRRELMGVNVIYCTISELMEQAGKKLEVHAKALSKADVDVDMLEYAQKNSFLTDLLKEIGITKPLDRNRFNTVLQTLTEKPSAPYGGNEETLCSSTEQEPEYIAYSTPV